MESLDGTPAGKVRCVYEPGFDCGSGELTCARLRILAPDGLDEVALRDVGGPGLDDLRSAAAQVAAWSAGCGRALVLCVGALEEALCDPAFPAQLNALLLETQLAPHCLEFCITTAGSHIADETVALLQRLKGCGIRFSLSATSPANAHVAWVRRLPLDAIDVPSHLVRDVVADPEGVAILRALVIRAHKMKLAVCATGVDDPHTASIVTATGCDQVCGPMFGAAMPAEAFKALLGRRLDNPLRRPKQERTLLLVDDEQNILASLRRLLRKEGYTILTATSGQEGLDLLATHPVDVIVSDQRMPGMTGVEFLRKAKDMDPQSVRMVLSGYTDLQSVTDAINEGAIYKFLTKPWDDAMLVANIDEAFRRKLLCDENRRLSVELQRANRELERINTQLTDVLADRERRLGVDEAVLRLTHEALAVMPLPLLGIDPCGMIALANAAAERLFAEHIPLIGLDAAAMLPPELLALVDNGTQSGEVSVGSRTFRVEAHPLGNASDARGTLLVFTCARSRP